MNARAEGTPARAALAVGDVSQLDHGHADHPVRPAKAVVLHHHLQLVAVGGLLPQDAAEQRSPLKDNQLPFDSAKPSDSNSQLKGFVELGRPAVVLGFGSELALLVGQEGTNQADFDKRPEHARRLPLHVVHCND